MNNNLNYSSEVRKKILSMLMFQLYSDERTIYREYVQNALDSINKAVENQILAQPKDGIVKVEIDKKNRIIKIKDNGTGINAKNAVRTLLDISPSTKDGVTQAGMYGIGRLVGGGYCHELIFRTSAIGEPIGTQIIFDVDRIWEMVEKDKEDYLATYVINECTKRESFETDESDHFFEVELRGVKNDAAPSLLDSDAIIAYLREVAPVEYKPEFKNTLIYKSTADNPAFKALHENLEKIQLFVGDIRIQKQYGLIVKGTKDKINNLEYFKIEDPNFGMLGWGWYGLTRYTIQIPKDDKLAGIRLRAHNIQIGDANQLSGTKYWKEERSNSYFYGEFFVTHEKIRPNGARDGLVPTPETSALVDGLRIYFDNLKTLYTKANEAKKCIDKINDGIKRIEEKGGVDYNSKDLINNKGIGKFEKLLKTSYGFDVIKKMLILYQPDFIVAKAQGEAKLKPEELSQLGNTNNVNTVTSPKSEPVAIVNDDSNNLNSRKQSEFKIEFPIISDSNIQPDPFTKGHKDVVETVNDMPQALLNGRSNISPTTTSLLGQHDIIASLNDILTQDEIWLLRRVFRVLNSYCPNNEHDKKLISEMENLIVREFRNGN